MGCSPAHVLCYPIVAGVSRACTCAVHYAIPWRWKNTTSTSTPGCMPITHPQSRCRDWSASHSPLRVALSAHVGLGGSSPWGLMARSSPNQLSFSSWFLLLFFPFLFSFRFVSPFLALYSHLSLKFSMFYLEHPNPTLLYINFFRVRPTIVVAVVPGRAPSRHSTARGI